MIGRWIAVPSSDLICAHKAAHSIHAPRMLRLLNLAKKAEVSLPAGNAVF